MFGVNVNTLTTINLIQQLKWVKILHKSVILFFSYWIIFAFEIVIDIKKSSILYVFKNKTYSELQKQNMTGKLDFTVNYCKRFVLKNVKF